MKENPKPYISKDKQEAIKKREKQRWLEDRQIERDARKEAARRWSIKLPSER